ncbi:right-handed parallel beta-helix repeat-containing protein, partial [Dactylosporangium sp. NPDC005555]|uniref:right-handed parallel beta-helix repeat-containing protein n=1 Tax=Dactylosporangium sp. NPDC005555 TaxID=3154889 RepID=UPI0033B0C2E5
MDTGTSRCFGARRTRRPLPISSYAVACSAGVLVEPAGELQLRRSRVRGGAAVGVRFAAGSRGTLSRSEVFDNGGDGVLLETAE